jgi:2Fe-2S ferredoxin
MAKVTFIEFSGTEKVVDAQPGESLMQAATDHMVSGIDADCGGSCACGTCHVYVDERWLDAVGKPDEMEEAMLDMRPEREAGSRLCCQIEVTEALDGLVLRLPEYQM